LEQRIRDLEAEVKRQTARGDAFALQLADLQGLSGDSNELINKLRKEITDLNGKIEAVGEEKRAVEKLLQEE
jgi:SepF-like predicted cell division protein (DUF552 family)